MHIPNGYAQVNLTWTGQSLTYPAQVTFGVRVLEEDDPAALAVAIKGAVEDLVPYYGLSTSRILTMIRVKYGPNDTGPFHELPTNIPGLNTDPPSAPNLSILVKKQTPVGGHSGTGRFYLPGIAEKEIDERGFISAAGVSDIQAKCTQFLASLEDQGTEMVILHAEEGKLPYKVVSLAVSNQSATQRRRMRRS